MKNNRWVILIASTIINFCITIIYAWSVFSGPLMELFGWSATATALTYTIANAVSPVPMIAGGKILNIFGPRKTVLCCAFLFGGGLFLSGFAKSVGWLYVTYGICCGVGMAVIYICTISNTIRFFPDKKGLASGILTAGAGMSSIVAAPVAQMLIDAKDVLFTFKVFGLVYFAIIVMCALFLEKAPDVCGGCVGHSGDDNESCGNIGENGTGEYTTFEMLKSPVFYLLICIYAIGACGGLMVISQTSNMAQEMIHVSAQTAAVGVSLVALGNTVGRLFWGTVSDKVGRYNVLPVIFILMAVFLFIFSGSSEGQWVRFVLSLVMIGISFGGLLSIFPAVTTEIWGAANSGSNYGLMFCGYALGSFIGPRIAVTCRDMTSVPYSVGLIAATCLCVIGAVLCLILRHGIKKI